MTARILIDAGHPAHVHLFQRAAYHWHMQGHQILFSALDREMIVRLLQYYGLPYQVSYKRRSGKLGLLVELILRTASTYRIARSFEADLFVSFGSPTVGIPAFLMHKSYLALTDTEHAREQHALFKPFATVIATPTAFTLDLQVGAKQLRYASFHELAYLHPDEFTPDPKALDTMRLTLGEPFFVVRFVAWGASHDLRQRGFTSSEKLELLQLLAQHGRVLLSVENDSTTDIPPFASRFPPELVHHLLAYAMLYVGEGATMASEAAMLGTPSVFVNTLKLGYCQELQDGYSLLYWQTEGRAAIERVRELLTVPNIKQTWSNRRRHMLAEKINPTPWLVRLGNELLERKALP